MRRYSRLPREMNLSSTELIELFAIDELLIEAEKNNAAVKS
jgi:hypothetical protein